jgi:hypothetical protein
VRSAKQLGSSAVGGPSGVYYETSRRAARTRGFAAPASPGVPFSRCETLRRGTRAVKSKEAAHDVYRGRRSNSSLRPSA